MRWSLLGFVVWVGGCISAEQYAVSASAAMCRNAEICYPDIYAGLGDEASCKAYVEPLQSCFEENCSTYDAKAAQDCIAETLKADCDAQEPLVGLCASAWSDCKTVSLALCQATRALP